MFDIVLYQPEIPPNTGNIIRLCANTGSTLHLIYPLGFDLDTKNLRRAGLDYHDLTSVKTYVNWDEFYKINSIYQIVAFTTKAENTFDKTIFNKKSFLLFGPETRGLPDEILNLQGLEKTKIPMQKTARSINLSNAVAIGVYEALRQHNYEGIIK